ncbi:transposase, MuDR, MULE transposase domain protein [Tanacetum coccineum]
MANEGTVTHIETDDEGRFKMCFVAFCFTAIYWKTCKAYTPEEFQRRITYLRSFRPEAYKKLEDAGFETWSRAMCPANRYNYMTSNSAESINNLTRHVRKAPVTKLMEWYRALLQKWYCDRREKYKDSNVHTLSDWATHKVMDRMQKSANWRVHGILHSKIYQVDDRRRVHRVDLNTRSCSCHKWQLSGIPCGHVIAVARVMGCTDCSELALASCHEPIPNYGRSQVEEYEAAYNNNNERSQEYEYEAAYNNNNGRSQEYAGANNNNYGRTQEYEYEAAYNNNNGRSQEYAGANNNNYGRTQEYEYEATYNNNNGRSQEYAEAYNNNYRRTQEYNAAYNNNYAGAYFNRMYDQPNNMGFAFNFGQSSQQTNSTWDHVNLADP